MEIALLELIKHQIPKTYKLSGITDKVLIKKIQYYLKRINTLPPEYILEKPHCLFDWILLTKNGDKRAISFLNFIENQCSSLLELVDVKFEKKIKGTIKQMLLEMDSSDIQPNNPAYMNFLAEIFGLLHLLVSSQGKYEIVEIEGSLSNGKSADFVFRNLETNDLIYIEFISYHNIDPSEVESNEELIKFLEPKFNEKILNKTKDLPFIEDRITIDGKEVLFAILPVIWTEINSLLPFKKAFEELESKYFNVLQCCSLHVQELDDGSFSYSFCSVNNILKDWQLEKENNKL